MPYRRNYRSRKRAVVRKKKNKKYVSKTKGRVSRRGKRVSYKTNPTIQHVFENTGTQREYRPVDNNAYNKQNFMTNTFESGFANRNVSLKKLIYRNDAFQKAVSNFGYVRFKWVRITLIPEKWNASTLQSSTGAELTDGEKPELHWINDNGTFFRDVEKQYPPDNEIVRIPIDFARQYSKSSYKSRLFTKNMKFYVKLYERQSYDSVVPFTSASRWIRTNTGADADYAENTQWIPDFNFFYGLSGANSDPALNQNFKWKEHVEFCCVFKEPDFRIVPVANSMANLSLENDGKCYNDYKEAKQRKEKREKKYRSIKPEEVKFYVKA